MYTSHKHIVQIFAVSKKYLNVNYQIKYIYFKEPFQKSNSKYEFLKKLNFM